LSLVFHHFLCELFDDIHVILLQLLYIIIFEALVLGKLATSEIIVADFTRDLLIGAESLDMFTQLRVCQALKLRQTADVAAIFIALIILGMLLKLTDAHP